MKAFPTIETVLAYQNTNLYQRYQKDCPHNQLSPEQALSELIKYLWLGQKQEADRQARPEDQSLDFICAMHPEMKEIDDMWHTFLLFTRDYEGFCKTYFGVFVHHIPTTEEADLPKDYEADLTRYLSYAYDHLGEETLRLWFAEHCDND
jgi:hypothetical protein